MKHIRIKPPESKAFEKLKDHEVARVGATPWHQDQGVITAEADESDIITVWFPLRDASEKHGCLAVAARILHEGLVQHCPATRGNEAGVGVHIRQQLIDGREVVPMPMKAGSALFMTKQTMHCSLRNTSDEIGSVSICASTRSGSRPGGKRFRASWRAARRGRKPNCTMPKRGMPSGTKRAARWLSRTFRNSIAGIRIVRPARRAGPGSEAGHDGLKPHR